MKQIKFTEEGLVEIKNKIDELAKLRPEVVKELSRARELGDLSENGLYHAAKAHLRSIDGQMRRLSYQVKLAQVVTSPTVIVEEKGNRIEYKIVGDYEADPKLNRISANSPIGRAMVGKSAGETVEINTPSGVRSMKIIEITS